MMNSLLGAGAQQALLGTSEEQMYADMANRYQNALAQSMVNTKNAVAQQVFTGQGARASTQPIKPFNPNEDPAFSIPLSQLVTLWQAHYGDQWVERFDEEFWANARLRLHENDKLEAVSGWFRIKEDA